jgi:Spy/CpxP family protein refolding chaperone
MRGFSMKSTVLLLGMTLTCSALVAQQATPQAGDAASATANQSTTSAAAPRLTAEQKKQLGEMRATERDQAAIIRNDQTLTAEQKQAKLKELHASTRAQMKAVLTPEQQEAFAARKSAGKAGFAAKLGLTTEQQSKLKELFQSAHQQRQSVLKDSSLTNEQKQTQLSQIRQTSKTQLATILTPEQLAQFQQMRKSHRHTKQG